ncbi:MAG TPA: hypothetical protein VKB50_18260 [Vicinamibacterales bacterium]|nr:hypothetical protein [Vicinamibacterales bacterium]
MIVVRCRRALLVIAMLFVAAWLVPASAEAAVSRHHGKRPRICQGSPNFCLAWKWHNRLSAPRTTHRPGSDDVFDDFDDRDTGIDPMAGASTDNDTTSASDAAAAPPWVITRRTTDPPTALLIVFRKLVAPRPPPSI